MKDWVFWTFKVKVAGETSSLTRLKNTSCYFHLQCRKNRGLLHFSEATPFPGAPRSTVSELRRKDDGGTTRVESLWGETLKLEIFRRRARAVPASGKTAQRVLKLICKLILSGRLSDVRLPPTAFLHNGAGRHRHCAVHQGGGEAAGSK